MVLARLYLAQCEDLCEMPRRCRRPPHEWLEAAPYEDQDTAILMSDEGDGVWGGNDQHQDAVIILLEGLCKGLAAK